MEIDQPRPVASREGHSYATERVTPIEEIPPEFQHAAPLPGGGTQVVDTRLCYNWQPGAGGRGGRYVECGSVAAAAEGESEIQPLGAHRGLKARGMRAPRLYRRDFWS